MSKLTAQSLNDLQGAVCLVTGGGTGIGLMAAKSLAANGAKVYISGRREEVLKTAVEAHGKGLPGSLVAIKSDVSSKEDVRALAKHIEEQDGKLHVLVNNAGIEGVKTPVLKEAKNLSAKEISELHLNNESPSDWAKVFEINTSALFFASMAMLPLLEAGNKIPPKNKSGKTGWSGSIINITSISGVVKMAQDHYAYNASKGAANHLTQLLSHTLSFQSILRLRVNAILPGLFATEMTAGKSTSGTNSSDQLGDFWNPADRAGEEEDIASAILFFANNQFTTGQLLAVDGGFVTAVASSR